MTCTDKSFIEENKNIQLDFMVLLNNKNNS